jgi:hypothetical protein
MADAKTVALLKLGHSGLTVADPRTRRARPVAVDAERRRSARPTSLLIDERYKKVRFLEIESGGFLGVGGQTRALAACLARPPWSRSSFY